MSRSADRGTKRKREDGDEKHRDEGQASFTSRDNVHGTNDKDCSKCKNIASGVKTSQCVLTMHVDIRSICPPTDKDSEGAKARSSKKGKMDKKQEHEQKKEKQERIDRKAKEKERIFEHVCALRNSMGGILLIYFTHMDDSDKSLGLFDELVDDRLNELIEDGALFHESYTRQWLEGEPNCLSITCNPSSTISTINYNTHINLNKGFARPTLLKMRYILSKDRSGAQYEKRSLHGLQEACNVQLKSFQHARKVAWTDWAPYIMDKLRLGEYISSFANQKGGGYYFLGVSEQDRTIRSYNTRKVSIEGFELGEELHETLKSEILEQVASKVLFLTPEMTIVDRGVITKSLKFTFHKVEGHSDIYVLEVYVPPFSGVVFSDRNGPESYHLNGNNCIQRVVPREWCQKVLEHPAS